MNALPFINMFNGKIKVTFVHAVTGKVIGKNKMKAFQLPEMFNKPMHIEWEGVKWRVMKAEPASAKDFTIDNKLLLHIKESSSIHPREVGFNVPTICDDRPEIVEQPLFDDFVLEIAREDWRQQEFFATADLPFVQEEMQEIEQILSPGKDIDTLSGYTNQYIRDLQDRGLLNISFDEFCKHISVREKGGICLPGKGFIKNGVAIRSENYAYYGILNSGKIEKLCLYNFDCVDEEFYQVASSYDLLLADWCNGRIIMI